ncbi:MAG: ion channel [Spirulina sp.]
MKFSKNKQKIPQVSVVGMGGIKFIRHGIESFHWQDFYHLLFTMSWAKLIGAISLAYLILNIFFALAYVIGGDCIANAQPGSFPDAFFFSVQTMATIGYGAMYPTTPYSNFLVVVEVFIGLLGVAMATGLMFARFSVPSARVLFSNVAVICPYNHIPTLMFRAANKRNNLILEAQINVTILIPETTPEGHSIRRLHDLKLVRSNTPVFSLSWMVMHPITEDSPLYGLNAEGIAELEAAIIVTLTGLDETLSQTVHARHMYMNYDILWDMRFVDVIQMLPNGDRKINYIAFHDVLPYS